MNNEKDLHKLSEQIKKASNILVAVNSNPTIDQLTSALALTLMLNKNDRRAVTIYSGETPDVLRFLKLDETFDKTVDGLRDFIVTLDSKKADRVVVKAEDGMVKVYVTPSGQTISSDDLGFEQGDYNIDLVIGVGVSRQDDLDKALAAHGRILHNASVVSLSIGKDISELGGLNIKAPRASSYAEIIYLLPELLDKNLAEDDDPAMDKAVATALLTSLVAVTNRFSNNRTTAEIMSLASDLMRAGANQQLIAKELSRGGVVEAEATVSETDQASVESAQTTVSIRPEADGEIGAIDLKTQAEQVKPEPVAESAEVSIETTKLSEQPKKKTLPSVDDVEIGPNFANLEEYNKRQTLAERQSTADEVLSRLPEMPAPVAPPVVPPIAPVPVSEDDRLAEQLQQVNQMPEFLTVETAATQTQPVAEPDPTIVFGKEVSNRPYLQDPSTAWGQQSANAMPVTETNASQPAELLRASIPQVPLPASAPVAPVAEPTPSVTAPEPPMVAASQPPLPPVPPQFDLPSLPDFGALNVTPPVPPTPPDFTLPMPPLPPNPADFAQPTAAAQQQFEAAAVPTPSVPQHPPIIPTGRYQPVNTPIVSAAGPVMTDQVYPPTPDNAQFIIPE